MTEQSPAEAIFFAALEKGTAEERLAYLDAACGDDSDLRQRVERLLAAHPQVGSFLEPPAQAEVNAAQAPTIPLGEKCPAGPRLAETAFYHGPGEGVGSVIAGRYKLLEQIGEGGMGTVWVAEQFQPVRRKVALKLIKAGMDSKTVLSRFEAERQALALMDHPNIAKVLDGGTTENGRPFFVMEYVKGIPFTKYCDDAHLSIAERLALFVPVCQAVQHAHQKGIIHRDLKPSNILVCLYDGRPVPKVIDFGLAKAMHQPLTEHTLHTAHGVMMGTPLYMSPEQAEFNNLDVDTRTDIYALGVVLYELLTGTTPLEKQRFQEAAWQEMLRVIQEEEPQRPSARLSGSASLPSLAAQRHLEPAKLARLVRGELDWIVMKCLEKDRSRRYDTANALVRDVERYLADEVVEARPASAGYRLRKFVHKHRVAIATLSVFAVLLIVSAGVTAMLAIKARRAEVVAENKRIEAEWNAKLAEHNLDLYKATLEENFKAYEDAEVRATGLKIDLDMEEVRTNPTVGVLRLARTLKMIPENADHTIPTVVSDESLEPLYELMHRAAQATGKNIEISLGGGSQATTGYPKMDPLREFGTMAVLATGQTFAPLLPPITHDGDPVQSSSLNSKGDRLLTRGADKTARLWDPFTGRQIALLRHADEKVIEAGLSPDGDTAFTLSLDGVVRLWETKDGAFRVEIDPRTGRIKSIDTKPSAPGKLGFSPWTKTQLSNDRVLTYEDMWKRVWDEANAKPVSNSKGPVELWVPRDVANSKPDSNPKGPVELWDAKTGRFIAQLELPQIDLTYQFFGNGRWIETQDPFRREHINVFSAENGRPIARLKLDEKYGFPRHELNLSPSGHTAGTVSDTRGQSIVRSYYVHFWDTTSWQLLSTTGPFQHGENGEYDNADFQLITDDIWIWGEQIFRAGTATPIAKLPGSSLRFLREVVLLDSGQLFETQTWRRRQPPKGRKYHPEIIRFAPDGRFVPVKNDRGEFQFLDTATEETSFTGSFPSFYQARLGWVGRLVCPYDNNSEGYLHRLPPPDQLDIPPDLLELWAQVAVRGQLDDEGAFVKWDEPTWEKKRQELAAKPAPYPDFPFPGHVAGDRLHWLRQEYGNAIDADKPRLAKQLLDRAEAVGDKAQAVRWRAIINAKSPPTKPAASMPSEP